MMIQQVEYKYVKIPILYFFLLGEGMSDTCDTYIFIPVDFASGLQK